MFTLPVTEVMNDVQKISRGINDSISMLFWPCFIFSSQPNIFFIELGYFIMFLLPDSSAKVADSSGFKFTTTTTSSPSSLSPPLNLFTKSSDSTTAVTPGGLFGSSSTGSAPTFSGFKFGTTGSVFGQVPSTSVTVPEGGAGGSTAETGKWYSLTFAIKKFTYIDLYVGSILVHKEVMSKNFGKCYDKKSTTAENYCSVQ